MATEEAKMYTAKDGAVLRFYWEARKNEFRSTAEGRPIFDKSLYVEIITPGSRDSTPVKEVMREYAEGTNLPPRKDQSLFDKYKEYIEDFINDADNPDLMGTSLSSWSALDITQIASLKANRIYTVEALASLPDGRLSTLGMGGRALRDRAKAFIDSANGSYEAEKNAARIVELEDELKRKDEQLAELDARITELTGAGANKQAKVKTTV
jgi:coenzyme F420-reducing hydrogenase alpha subunit